MKIELEDDEVEVLATAAHGNAYVAQFVESMVRGFIAAQQSAQRTAGTVCEKHGVEWCVECFPVVKVDFTRRR